MEKYHKYVFDIDKRKFLGNFEEMYINEDIEGYDSWHQDKIPKEYVELVSTLFKKDQFENVLDIGCGKGALTNLIRDKLNIQHMTAIDISPTAISKARKRYKQIDFLVMDAFKLKFNNKFDLVICSEIFWYLLRDVRLFVSLYIPENPIGKEIIATERDLVNLIKKYFRIKKCGKYLNRVYVLARKEFGNLNIPNKNSK